VLQGIAVMTGGIGASVARFRDAILRSLFPSTPAELKLVDDQLTQARAATRGNLVVGPMASLLLVLFERNIVPLAHLIFWPMAISLASLVGDLHYRHLLQRADHGRDDIRRRARASVRITILLSLAWCAMAFDLAVPDNTQSSATMFVVLACSIAGWSSIGAYHLATATCAMPIYLATMVAMPLVVGHDGKYFFAALAAGYWLMLRTHLMNNYQTRERMLRLEYERTGLIDNLKTAKDDSDAARLRAEHASRAKSAFLANMSHELRTPLNAILGFSEIISAKAMGPAAVDQYAEYGGYIHGSGEHLLSLINDILDLAKIEAGRLSLRESELDIRALIGDTAKMMKTRAAAGGIALSVAVDPDFPNVYADERAMRQILVNLASNAVKFTQPGGRVTTFASVLADGSLAIGIEDSGIGIALEEHAKVFESFGQGRHDAVLADKGTGLGLPIVKGLAEAHGGRVDLVSASGKGTRITVVLPRERARTRLRVAS
jgi:two-component system, cell cycle sensor histidine kinase PleC